MQTSAAHRLLARALKLARTPGARRIAVWTGTAVVLFAILGFFVAPPIARWQLEQVLAETLHRQVTIERIRINPFAASASVFGFAVKDRGGEAPVLSFDEVYINFSYASLVRF